MKRKLFLGALLFVSANVLFFTSCGDDGPKPLAPTVKITALGSGHDNPDDKIAYAGSDVHLEAVITAGGLIRDITVEVRQKEGEYKFDKVYDGSKYAGLKNATLHEHLDIPAEAPIGEYHLRLVVSDRAGQTATAESGLTVKAKAENHEKH